MPSFPILELSQDGDVSSTTIKYSGQKPILKDVQLYLKKKVLPTLITSYPYGSKRISIIGYTKGKDSDVSQHQLPPPSDAVELYGSIILIAHHTKSTWDTGIEIFTPADYELFYEKACSGELDDEIDVDEVEAEPDDDKIDEINDDIDDDIDELELDVEPDAEELEPDAEEEVAPRSRVIRKIKIDPQQLQFQFKSTLVTQLEVSDVVLSVKERQHTVDIFKTLVREHCSDTDILELEMGIFNASIEEAIRRLIPLTWDHDTFKWIYAMISKRTVSNFQPTSYVGNSSLIERWKDGEFSLNTLGHWSPYELNPAHWKDLKDQQFRREQRILEGNLAMATDRFRCSRCQKKLCSYYELQTRSADEPMTIFISCLNCGKRWKQ